MFVRVKSCLTCGGHLRLRVNGRPRLYCSNSCKMKHYRISRKNVTKVAAG